MVNTLPKLGYEYNALEPYIDEMTMRIHHTKHHQAYTDKLNGAIKGTKFENMDLKEVIKDINSVPEEIRATVRNNGGGHLNHTLFWEIMSPKAGGEPVGAVSEAIRKTFGTFQKLKEDITSAGLNRFGSGWAWLVIDKGKLSVLSTPNQDSPIIDGKSPILGVDVWEHAYYLKYQNKRADYLAAFWNVVNWKRVNELFEKDK